MADTVTPMPPPTVLVLNVNDDLAARYVISRTLQREGFEVIEAINGEEALRLAHRQPDLIILDVNLPDIDGFEVCRTLKSDPATGQIPVLHISANRVAPGDRTFGLESGADGYLVQPVESAELTATIRALLRLTRAEKRSQSAAREWQTVFNAIGDGVCLFDAEGRAHRCNRAMEELTGLLLEEIIGHSYAEIVSHAFPNASLPAFREVGAERERSVREVATGARWVRVATEPVLPDSAQQDRATGETEGMLIVLTDITATKESAIRQRSFLQQVLASVTEGKLSLCDGPEELPAPLIPAGEPLELTKKSIRDLRAAVVAASLAKGFADERWQDIETAVGEAAMNAVVHARDGFGRVCAGPDDTVQVWIEDRGGGIAIDRLPQATLERGYTTAGSLGHGFWLILKTVDRVWLLTGESGTTVVLEQDREASTPSWLNRV